MTFVYVLDLCKRKSLAQKSYAVMLNAAHSPFVEFCKTDMFAYANSVIIVVCKNLQGGVVDVLRYL